MQELFDLPLDSYMDDEGRKHFSEMEAREFNDDDDDDDKACDPVYSLPDYVLRAAGQQG